MGSTKYHTRTVEVEVEVEVGLEEWTDQELRDELASRPDDGSDFIMAFSEQAVIEWLRKADPPQVVRDAFWNTFGRIL